MTKNTIAKIAVLATAIVSIGAWTYAHSYRVPEPPKFEIEQKSETFDVCEYERLRANLYDAAMNLCIEAQGSYDWEEGLDNDTKRIITEYRTPSLKILLKAIDTMDEFGGDLADSFDVDEGSPLYVFDQARKAYDKYLAALK